MIGERDTLIHQALTRTARHKGAVDMTIFPNGNPPPDGLNLLKQIRVLDSEIPQDVRIIRRRVKRRGPK